MDNKNIISNGYHDGVEKHEKLPICVDFDGTVVTHKYPNVGRTVPHCVETLKKWTDNGVGIVLDTMRDGETLEAAIKWFNDNDIPLYGIGKDPYQDEWTESNKAYGIMSVDDRNLGVPLNFDSDSGRNCVDWKAIDRMWTGTILMLAESYK